MTHLERLVAAIAASEGVELHRHHRSMREGYVESVRAILAELRSIAAEPDVEGFVVDKVFGGGIEDASIIPDIINSALDRIIGEGK